MVDILEREVETDGTSFYLEAARIRALKLGDFATYTAISSYLGVPQNALNADAYESGISEIRSRVRNDPKYNSSTIVESILAGISDLKKKLKDGDCVGYSLQAETLEIPETNRDNAAYIRGRDERLLRANVALSQKRYGEYTTLVDTLRIPQDCIDEVAYLRGRAELRSTAMSESSKTSSSARPSSSGAGRVGDWQNQH